MDKALEYRDKDSEEEIEATGAGDQGLCLVTQRMKQRRICSSNLFITSIGKTFIRCA